MLHEYRHHTAANPDIDVVETKNLSLEETAALFDGEEATQELAHAHVEGGVVPKEAIDEKSSGSSMHEAAEVPNLKK